MVFCVENWDLWYFACSEKCLSWAGLSKISPTEGSARLLKYKEYQERRDHKNYSRKNFKYWAYGWSSNRGKLLFHNFVTSWPWQILFSTLIAEPHLTLRLLPEYFPHQQTQNLIDSGEELQDGGRIRRGDHLPPHKYIRNTSTCGTAPTEQLLNAGRRPQTSQKARNPPRTWVGQKKKKKNRDKRIGTGPAPVGGSCEGGKVSTH